MPTVKSILMSTWDRIAGCYISRAAGTIIFPSTIVIWLPFANSLVTRARASGFCSIPRCTTTSSAAPHGGLATHRLTSRRFGFGDWQANRHVHHRPV